MAEDFTINGESASIAPYSQKWRQIPVGRDHTKRAIYAGNEEIDLLFDGATVAMARDHMYVFSGIQEQNVTFLATIENILDRGLIETNLRMLKRHTSFFNIGLLLAYLNLKWFEVRNLRTIIRGSECGISPDIVKKMLVLPI